MLNDLKGYVQLLVASLKGEEGQGLVEYSLILALVSILSVAALSALSVSINGVFTAVTGALSAV
jgi:Flp pilus assembly pilin Flp